MSSVTAQCFSFVWRMSCDLCKISAFHVLKITNTSEGKGTKDASRPDNIENVEYSFI